MPQGLSSIRLLEVRPRLVDLSADRGLYLVLLARDAVGSPLSLQRSGISAVARYAAQLKPKSDIVPC